MTGRETVPCRALTEWTPAALGVLAQRKCACGVSAGLDDRCEGCRRRRLTGQPSTLQPKLRIGPENDRYERQADRVADAVMRTPAPGSTPPLGERITPLVQRQQEEEDEQELQAGRLLDPGRPPLQRQAEPEEEEEEESPQTRRLQRQAEPEEEEEEPAQAKRAPAGRVGVAPRLVGTDDRGGQALPDPTRAFFESRLGFDFSRVRIHTGGAAADSARRVGARAYTVGRNIVFGAGEYSPQSSEGRRLLAHELTHVVQQRAASASHAPARIQREAAAAPAAEPLDAPFYISFTHVAPPPSPDHTQANPGPTGGDADRAGFTRVRLRRRLTTVWGFGAARGEGAERTIPMHVRSANVLFRLDPIEVFVSSSYAEGSCPYRVTRRHEYEHVGAFLRIFREHRAEMVREANAITLPTADSPAEVPADQVDEQQTRILQPVVAAINRVRGAMLRAMATDRAEKDSPASYARIHARCPEGEW